MFMGPLEMSKPWNSRSIEGVRRFLARTWRLVVQTDADTIHPDFEAGMGPLSQLVHQTIRGVGDDIENLRFNTAISKMMVLVNGLTNAEGRYRDAVECLLLLLAPFAPHICEELWSLLGHTSSISLEPWPAYDEALCAEDLVTLVIQINGKKRDSFDVPAGLAESEALSQAKQREKVLPWLQDSRIVKEIFVPDKLINIVVRPA